MIPKMGLPHPSTSLGGRVFGWGPATASWVLAVARSLGALGALLRMTMIRRQPTGTGRDWWRLSQGPPSRTNRGKGGATASVIHHNQNAWARRVAHPLCVVLFCPVSKPWVPRSCAFCKGGYDAADIMGCYAERPDRTYGAFEIESREKISLQATVVPALRKESEERGTHWVAHVRSKGWATRPSRLDPSNPVASRSVAEERLW